MNTDVRTTTALPRRCDCVIIGGGVIGAATAFHARRAGLTPVIVEKRAALATLTTAASAGGFRAQFDDADEIALMRESIAVFESFADHVGLPVWELGLRQQGYLWATTRPDGPERQRAAVLRQRQLGLGDVEQLDGSAARRRFPFLAPEVTSVRFRAADGWLDPVRLALGFAVASRAEICVETEVTGFGFEGGRLSGVRTTRGEISCAAAVIAGGPFAAKLAALAEVTLPIELMTRHKVFVAGVPEIPADAPMTIDQDTGAHWRPEADGALVLCPHADAPTGPPLDDVPGSATFASELLREDGPLSVGRVTPFWKQVALRNPSHRMTSGQYALTPDRKPLLGATSREGLFVNAGYSGHGIMGSAAGSRIVIDTLLDPGATRNPFTLGRAMPSGDPARGPL
jgi:sarcosine oxidase subunit beta